MRTAKVNFLDETYKGAVGYLVDTVKDLTRLQSELRSRSELTNSVNSRLHSTFGFGDQTTIDGIVEQQLINAYLAGKGIVVLYPESGAKRFSSGLELIFPYNLDPNFSLVTLVALGERYGKGYQFNILERVPMPGEFNGKEDALITATLNYLVVSQPFGGDRRGYRGREIHSTAKIFMERYEALKKNLTVVNERTDFKNFVLTLAYVAAYNRMKETLTVHEDLGSRFESSREFFDVPQRGIDLDEVLGYKGKTPIKKYIKVQELARLTKRKKWGLVRAELSKEPTTKNATRNS